MKLKYKINYYTVYNVLKYSKIKNDKKINDLRNLTNDLKENIYK